MIIIVFLEPQRAFRAGTLSRLPDVRNGLVQWSTSRSVEVVAIWRRSWKISDCCKRGIRSNTRTPQDIENVEFQRSPDSSDVQEPDATSIPQGTRLAQHNYSNRMHKVWKYIWSKTYLLLSSSKQPNSSDQILRQYYVSEGQRRLNPVNMVLGSSSLISDRKFPGKGDGESCKKTRARLSSYSE